MSPNTIGAFLMMASMACFTLNDTLIKLTDGTIPLFQLICLRGLLTTLLILGTKGLLGPMHLDIAQRDWGFIALRCAAEIGAAYFFLSALMNMPLGNISAILQVAPLAITLASAVFLREAVGWRRMLAIAVGFFGVMLIVKPGAEGFNVWSVYALISVLCVTVRDLSTRQLSKAVPAMTVTLVTAGSITIAAGLASLGAPWVLVSQDIALLIAGASVFVLGGYFFSIQVMRTGDVSFVAPFRYTGLIWALVLGWFVFSDWPGWMTLTGAFIVVSMGIFTLYRERKISAR